MNIKWNHMLQNSNVPSTLTTRQTLGKQDLTFEETFRRELQNSQPLKVSKHAAKRIEDRSLDISLPMWQRIGQKVDEAHKKGVNDPLVLTPEVAMIVSAKNHTVITAMAREELNDQIFTNIDGTIVLQ